MASSSTQLGDIEEEFLQCSFCGEIQAELKTLPCLHRGCRECLKKIIADKRDAFKCPICNEECDVPPDGVDGFKTDFIVMCVLSVLSVLEFLRLDDAYKRDSVQECRGCKEDKPVTCYCFKCRGFLCHQCYTFHLDNNIVEEHRPHLLDLQTVDVRSLTLEKILSLTGGPRCTVHVERPAKMCCETCGDTPICFACVFNGHKGHVIHEVMNLAKSERTKMKAMMSTLDACRAKLEELNNVREQLAKATIKHKDKSKLKESKKVKESRKVLEEAEMKKAEMKKWQDKIIMRKEEECEQVRKAMNEEMKELKRKYDTMLQGKEQICRSELGKLDIEIDIVDDKPSAQVGKFIQELQGYEKEVKTSKLERLLGVVDHASHTIRRYENLAAIAKIAQASHDEWSEAQCLPAITSAGEVLIEDAMNVCFDLESLSTTDANSTDSVIDIEDKGMEGGWDVQGITSSKNGQIVVTGWADRSKSHITVIRLGEGVVRRKRVNKVAGSQYRPDRYCQSLKGHITATVCESNQVGLFNNRNGEYRSENIKDMHINWPGCATCVATDTFNNIYVGGNKRMVLVLDDQLNYIRTIKLPEIINWARDIVVHGKHLIVCDALGHRSYAVTLQGEVAKVVYQFARPDGNWRPRSVCIDNNQYIYMLWASTDRRILAKYSQDGRQLLTARNLFRDARCITTMGTEKEERLLIATEKSMKVHVVSLLKIWIMS